jgi:hypothetical protein
VWEGEQSQEIGYTLEGLTIRCAFRLVPLSGTGTPSATQNLHSWSLPPAEGDIDRWEKTTKTNQVSSNTA